MPEGNGRSSEVLPFRPRSEVTLATSHGQQAISTNGAQSSPPSTSSITSIEESIALLDEIRSREQETARRDSLPKAVYQSMSTGALKITKAVFLGTSYSRLSDIFKGDTKEVENNLKPLSLFLDLVSLCKSVFCHQKDVRLQYL